MINLRWSGIYPRDAVETVITLARPWQSDAAADAAEGRAVALLDELTTAVDAYAPGDGVALVRCWLWPLRTSPRRDPVC